MTTKDNTKGEIKFRSEGVLYTLQYERYYQSEQIEKIKVFGKEKEIHFQNDRPSIITHKKRKAPNWKIISGLKPELFGKSPFIAQLLYVLESVLNEIDNGQGPSYQEYLRNKKSW